MRDTRADRRVLLLYGNTNEQDIIFRQELEGMEVGTHPQLKVVHVLSDASEKWQGEKGRLDAEKIERHCGEGLSQRAFYVCAPPAAMTAVVKCLRDRGVPAKNIHFERFNL